MTSTRIQLIFVGRPELLEHPSFGKIIMDGGRGVQIFLTCAVGHVQGVVVAGQTIFLTYGMDFHSGQGIESSALKNIQTLQLVKINFQSVSFVTINHYSYTALAFEGLTAKAGKAPKSLDGSPLLSRQNSFPCHIKSYM
jgi:hypothetical protein